MRQQPHRGVDHAGVGHHLADVQAAALCVNETELQQYLSHLRHTNSQLVAAVSAWDDGGALESEVQRLRARNKELESQLYKSEHSLREKLESAAADVQQLTRALLQQQQQEREGETPWGRTGAGGGARADPAFEDALKLRQEVVRLGTEADSWRRRCAEKEAALAQGAAELEAARKELRAMQSQLLSLRRHHSDTELHKQQTVSYLHRYERELRQQHTENAELRRKLLDLSNNKKQQPFGPGKEKTAVIPLYGADAADGAGEAGDGSGSSGGNGGNSDKAGAVAVAAAAREARRGSPERLAMPLEGGAPPPLLGVGAGGEPGSGGDGTSVHTR
jgi:predicted RNase H-like nuclease (RuvC/YqgF family)